MKSYKFPSVKKIWGIRNYKSEKKTTKKFWKKSNRIFPSLENFPSVRKIQSIENFLRVTKKLSVEKL